jgi:hypothetical protein
MPKPDADPHGGIDAFNEIENPNICLPNGGTEMHGGKSV